ncbi:hypothetical protein HK405_006775, partial [Cladochytrium tenue]
GLASLSLLRLTVLAWMRLTTALRSPGLACDQPGRRGLLPQRDADVAAGFRPTCSAPSSAWVAVVGLLGCRRSSRATRWVRVSHASPVWCEWQLARECRVDARHGREGFDGALGSYCL